MTIVQTYILTAGEGREAALEDTLRRLAAVVGDLEGCEAVEILREVNDPRRYVVMETYVDAAAHAASASNVPRQLLGEMMALLTGKPEVLTLTPA